MLHLHTGRHVNETATAKDCAIEGAKLIVSGRNNFTKPFPEDLRVLLKPFRATDENHALIRDRLLDVGIDRLGIELSFDPG